MRYQAFQGSQARKNQLVEPLRAKWAAGQILPMSYLKWRTDGGLVSLSGALAETQDPQLFVERTGLPVELGSLCEGLVYVGLEFREDESAPLGFTTHGGDAVLSFGMEWLDTITVGQDLGDVVPRFMQSFLTRVLASDFAMAAHVEAPVRAAAERILDFWSRELSGEAIPPKAWRAARADALRASEVSEDPWGYPLAEMVESLAWPVRGLAMEFVPIFQLFAKSWIEYLASPYLSREDRDGQVSALIGGRDFSRAQRDPQRSHDADEALLDSLPEAKRAMLAAIQPEVKARVDEAKRQARATSDRLLRGHMDTVLDLIRGAGDRLEAPAV